MSDGFYRAFEDKHRGTLELIKERQRVYLPLITPLLSVYPGVTTMDLGCGRGEWLELLVEAGFDAHGIDLDDGMLAECRKRGLQVKTQDALTALKELPDNSQAIVSGFHFAEHIPFDVLQEVVQQALRVLKPAGLLILETPNPENISVGTANFYLDPSHNRPLPPLLMEFLPEYYGFYRVKILRLQEPFKLSDERKFGIHDVLGGVSPDYAVVAQKAADPVVLQKVSQALDKDYGVTLGMIASRYEGQRDEALQALDQRANENLVKVDQTLRTQIQVVEGNFAKNLQHQLNTLDYKLNVLIQQVDANQDRRLVLLERQLSEAESQLQKIEARRPISLIKRVIKKVLRVFSNRTKVFLSHHPGLHGRLVATARKIGIYKLLNRVLNRAASGSSAAGVNPMPTTNGLSLVAANELGKDLKDQSAEVQDIYREIESAIKKTESH